MRIIQLTPGTGNFHCGTCLRDHALVTALGRLGHEPLMVPIYLPLVLDSANGALAPVDRTFFGGLNVYLQQKSALFRHTPAWFDRLLAFQPLLRWAARGSSMTSAQDLGAITISMLRGEDGRQHKELDKLLSWLGSSTSPDIVCLSNVLLIGMAKSIRRDLGVPVVCTLQGEDGFLDALVEPARSQAWRTLAEQAVHVDGFIAISHYYAEVMTQRLSLRPDRVHVVHNGIELDDLAPAEHPPTPPVLGYLARMCPAKGLDQLVDAFLILRNRKHTGDLRLHVTGAKTSADSSFVRSMQQLLEPASSDVTWSPNVNRSEKLSILRQLSVLSVPATYGEAFGLYVLEALASGVPVVQPRHGAFEELLGLTGGGVLVDPNNPVALADGIEAILVDDLRRQSLATVGRQNVLAHFSADRMADQVVQVLRQVSGLPQA